MSSRIKKISLVVYCDGANNDFNETKKTLYSIVDQKVSHLFFEVLIINDNATEKCNRRLNKFIEKEELQNYKIFSFEGYSGLPATFNFLLKNNIVKSRYVTVLKSGDRFNDGWLEYFLENLFVLGKDLYMTNHKEELIVPKKQNKDLVRNYTISKSKSIISDTPSGDLSQEEAIATKAIFFGKIWRVSKIRNVVTSKHRILYQDIFLYYQMILNCFKIWYENKISGTARYNFWIPEVMDEERIKLLSLTLNKMISKNPHINGQVLQLLALALKRTPKDLKKMYLLNNHSKLKNNYKIVPLYNLSKWKITRLSKPFIRYGSFELRPETVSSRK